MKSKKVDVVYYDTCVVVAYFKQEQFTENRYDRARHLFDEASKGSVRLYTSAITLAEVYRGLADDYDVQKEKLVQAFFSHSWNRIVETNRRVADEARKLMQNMKRQGHTLKVADAIQLASAIVVGASRVYTFDGDDLLSINGLVPNLVIEYPPLPAQSPIPVLFSSA